RRQEADGQGSEDQSSHGASPCAAAPTAGAGRASGVAPIDRRSRGVKPFTIVPGVARERTAANIVVVATLWGLGMGNEPQEVRGTASRARSKRNKRRRPLTSCAARSPSPGGKPCLRCTERRSPWPRAGNWKNWPVCCRTKAPPCCAAHY